MTELEWGILDSIARPNHGKYLAQYKQGRVSTHWLKHEKGKLYFLKILNIKTNKEDFYSLEAINSADIWLLPIRKTLKQYIENCI